MFLSSVKNNSSIICTIQTFYISLQRNFKSKIMAQKNRNLNAAKIEKNDEFYTRIQDIEKELFHYREHFRDKVILCNCDDPRVSQFFNYFFLNFKFFGLKKLIATCYKSQEWNLFSQEDSEKAVYIVYSGELDDSPMPREERIQVRPLEGDGDFRSAECRAFLELADIVVTNPPFSLFREFVALMEEYEKKFIVLGNVNNVTYKNVFPLFKHNKMWLGYNINTSKIFFNVPDDYKLTGTKCGIDENGKKYIYVNGIRWFTNLPVNRTKESEILFKKYNEKDYQKYDNFDAINVNKVSDIPVDYYGVMGVPISFIDKWNPSVPKEYEDIVTTNDFEIVGITCRNYSPEFITKKYSKEEYKNAADLNGSACIIKNGKPQSVYCRFLIKRKR